MLHTKYLLKENWNPQFLSNCNEDEFNLFLNEINKDKKNLSLRKNMAFHECYEAILEINCPVFVTGGSLLGIIRDNELIEWDDDIDMDMMQEDFSNWKIKLKETFIEKGFVVRLKDSEYYPKMRIFAHGIKVSIDALFLKNDKRVRPAYNYLDIFFRNSELYSYKGLDLLVPGPPKEFLKYVYGKNWKIPIKSNNDVEYMSSKVLNRSFVRFFLKKTYFQFKNFFFNRPD